MLTSIIITITCFLTATLSGVFGLGGGILLMGFLGAFFSIPVAMVLHGIIQAFSNGSRAYFLRSHIQWKLLPVYALGVLTALILCSFFIWTPQKSIVFIILGSFPFLYLSLVNLTLNESKRKTHAFFCGIFVTATNLLRELWTNPRCFLQRKPLNRREIVATKALPGYGSPYKTCFYCGFLNVQLEGQLPLALIPWMVITTLFGSFFGKEILSRLNDEQFKGWGEKIILSIGVFFLCQGFIN